MEDRVWLTPDKAVSSWIDSEMEALARPCILLVEDDADTRALMVTLLEIAGLTPRACATAEEGLERLREQQFDLVLTDYMLPHRSGAWLLRQASEEGLLDGTPALVVTAHPSPRDTDGFEIISKPFDLDELVSRVRYRLENGAPRASRRSRPARSAASGPGNDGHDDCPEPIELILYVSAHSPRSATAIAALRAALRKYESSRVRLTICDLSKDPALDYADSVAFTPALVKRPPGPRTYILGHLTSPELLLELLDSCEEN